ncbi:cytochrome P450 [Nocardia huaxiensis]|uniref:cytochrome P450 n=1 Tax=Nocardia huaxiensis TaxID=2755382 RepID=UPI001E627302|nr:cytochrome P450 [Nocardia huaxiensis]UFS98137.1 cytochrome P450 [Nocardia huaxiensis]
MNTNDLPQYPMRKSASCPFAPASESLELAAAAPLSKVRIWDGKTPWLVTDYAVARELFADARVSVDYRDPGFPHIHEGMKMLADGPRSMFNTDGSEHARYRRMLAKPFTPKRLDILRPMIQQHVDQHLDVMLAAGNSADLAEAFALPVPSTVICEMLGVPYDKHRFFQEHTEVGFSLTSTPEEKQQSMVLLLGFLNELVAAKLEAPGEDALSDLAEHVRAGELEVWEAALQGLGMLVAGHETTASMICLSVAALLQEPDKLALVRDAVEPKVLGNAIDELLRYMSIVHSGVRRVALADIEIGGELIRAGDGIVVELPTANWDPKVFDHPDQLDFSRSNANAHIAFGHSRHICIGLQLARIELEIVLQTLFRRVPTLRLMKPLEELDFKFDGVVHGLHTLPVEW